MDAVSVELKAHVTRERLARRLDAIAADLEGEDRANLLFDCLQMSGFEPEARNLFVEWHTQRRECIDRTAVVTTRPMWHAVVGAMSGLSRVEMRAFDRHAEAAIWLGGGHVPSIRTLQVHSLALAPSIGLARGIGITTAIRWLQERVSDTEWSEILAALPRKTREVIDSLQPLKWYPVGIGGDLFEAYGTVCFPNDTAGHRTALERLGRFIADDNIESLYRVMFDAVTPAALFRMLPRTWARYYQGVRVEVEAGEDENSGCCRVYGLQRAKHLAPVASGWIARAFERVGANGAWVSDRITREGEDDGELVFDIRWGEAS